MVRASFRMINVNYFTAYVKLSIHFLHLVPNSFTFFCDQFAGVKYRLNDLERVARNSRQSLMNLWPSKYWHESAFMRELKETRVPRENPRSQVDMDWISADI
mgnify:CR=1 FL=1